MDSFVRDPATSADAVEFVRFCYRRRQSGWPELYDEMCAVAHRGLFRGWGNDELSAEGIGFSLFELPALAALVGRVVAEENERRAYVQAPARVSRAEPVAQQPANETSEATVTTAGPADRGDATPKKAPALRLTGATAGA